MQSAPSLPALSLLLRGASLLVVWWALTLGETSALGFGLGVTALVAWLSVRLFPPSGYRLQPLGLLSFLGYFLTRSVVAGLDVARRLLSPALPVHPGEITLTLYLPEGSPRWLLANTLSLMRGTPSALLEGDQLTLHSLETRAPVAQDVAESERQLARVFAPSLSSIGSAVQSP